MTQQSGDTHQETSALKNSQPHPDGRDDEKTVEMVREAVVSGITLKEVHGISEEMMESLYAYAHDFYGKGQLDEAEKFFRFLCLYDFYNIDYIMGLAAVCQMKKQYSKAIGLYAVAFGMSKNDYRPMFFTGQCHLFEGKTAKARQCFELVILHCSDTALLTKAQAYVDVLANARQDREATAAGE